MMTESNPVSAQPDPDVAPTSPKHIVICMDGTWSNPAKQKERDDGDLVLKPSNVLKACRAVKELDDTTATLVLTGQPQVGETVTIDGKVFTFQEQLTDVDGHVQIASPNPSDDPGEEMVRTLKNLRQAINTEGPSKNHYAASTTPHPTVRARAVGGDQRAMEIFVTPQGIGRLPVVADVLESGFWVDKQQIAGVYRQRGLDPSRGIPQIAYYDIGVGALRKFPGFSNRVHRTIDKLFGGAAGAGFEGNVEDAYTFLSLNFRPGDEIYLFEFSRGASSARGLARFIDWMGGVLPAEDSYWIPRYFDEFLNGKISGGKARKNILDERIARRLKEGKSPDKAKQQALEIVGDINPAPVDFLGLWDTVLSIGKRRERVHVGVEVPAGVRNARQALAIDERRADFCPRIWQKRSSANGRQTLKQRWFAGVHTNVGGGYVNDGLANTALRWLLTEARGQGLGIDWEYLKHYDPNPYGRLYKSDKLHWRVIQTLTLRNGKGVRKLSESEPAGLAIHPSVLVRLAAESPQWGESDAKFVPYRPKNLLRYLASVSDFDQYLQGIEGLPEGFDLPKSVRDAIAAAR